MARWKFWQRKQQTSQEDPNLPDEVQEYYQSTRRERVGVAWLLAFATVIVTLLLALLLYFGGRWVVDKYFTDDDSSVDIVQQEDVGIPGESEQDDQDREDSSVDESEFQESQDTRDQEERNDQVAPTDDQATNGDRDQQRETPTSLPSDSFRTSETPATGAESIPDTGPGAVLALFGTVSAATATIHYFVRRK